MLRSGRQALGLTCLLRSGIAQGDSQVGEIDAAAAEHDHVDSTICQIFRQIDDLRRRGERIVRQQESAGHAGKIEEEVVFTAGCLSRRAPGVWRVLLEIPEKNHRQARSSTGGGKANRSIEQNNVVRRHGSPLNSWNESDRTKALAGPCLDGMTSRAGKVVGRGSLDSAAFGNSCGTAAWTPLLCQREVGTRNHDSSSQALIANSSLADHH
jgi:hypothetical protein